MSRPPTPRPVFRAVLLRALLCMALLVNGIGAAAASARVAVMGIESAVPAHAPAEPLPVVDCHGTGSPEATPAMPPAHVAHAVSDDDSAHAGHGDDCAQFCLDACMQHCHAVVALAMPSVVTVHAAAPWPGTGHGRASAPQPPLLRPPIV